MGNFFGRKFIVSDRTVGQGPDVIITAGKLRIRRSDIDAIFRQFCKIDTDDSGLISVNEFVIMNKVQSQAFGEMCFRVLDKNNSGNLDFLEYMVSMWNYCSLGKDSLAQFTFQIFDTDDSEVLSLEELNEMLSMIWGFKKSEKVESILRMLDKNKDGSVSQKEFIAMVRHTPILLFPAFEMQERLRGVCLGGSQWERMSAERYDNFGYSSVFEILGRLEEKKEYLETAIDNIAT